MTRLLIILMDKQKERERERTSPPGWLDPFFVSVSLLCSFQIVLEDE